MPLKYKEKDMANTYDAKRARGLELLKKLDKQI